MPQPARLARALAALLCAVVLGGCAATLERPRYEVVEAHEAFELRRYAPYVVAETVVEGDFFDAGRHGFLVLFDYIGGDNAAEQDIAMTAPVTQLRVADDRAAVDRLRPLVEVGDADGEQAHALRFVMPSAYALEELPAPADDRVRLRRVEPGLVAAHTYSGTWSLAHYREHERRLLEALPRHGLRASGTPVFARYNGPITPWFLRRNEIWVEVDRQ